MLRKLVNRKFTYKLWPSLEMRSLNAQAFRQSPNPNDQGMDVTFYDIDDSGNPINEKTIEGIIEVDGGVPLNASTEG